MAVVVREDVAVGHLFDRGQVTLERRVPQPHRGIGVERAEREVLRHPLHEPQRWVDADHRLHAAAGVPTAVHIVLKLVDHLVLEHVLQLGVRPRERQDHAVLEELRDAAQTLTLGVHDVRLLEVRL